MAGAGQRQVEGGTTQAEAHPAAPARHLESAGRHFESAGRQRDIQATGNQTVIHLAFFGPRNEEIGTFTTLLPSLLKMTFLQETRRKRRARMSGGPRDDPRELAVAGTSC